MPRRRKTATPSNPPRQARSKATVDAIVAAAARVVARDGYAEARMATIATRAGVSVGSIYQYFPSKDALVTALVRSHIQRGWDLFLTRIAALPELSLRDAVRALVACAVEGYRIDAALSNVIFYEIPRGRAFAGLPDFGDQLVEMLASYLATRSGLLRRSRVGLALRILVTSVVEVMASVTAKDPTLAEREALVDELSDLVCRYLLADPEPALAR